MSDLAVEIDRRSGGGDATSARILDRGPRLALAVFIVVEIAAIPIFLRAGEKQWFFLDDFDFLATRSLADPIDLLRPHYEHWTTLPIVVYRLLWAGFGLNSYVPYQLVAIGSHLTAAALLRVLMRRMAVSPWMATIVASVIVLFGAGNENMVWAFQITFTGCLVFGMVQLLLSRHDGPIDRRDWFGLLAGLAALMCAAPGVVMVLVVGAAALLRGRWRAAIFHTAPLLAIYGLWSVFYGQFTPDGPLGPPGPGLLLRFVWRGLAVAFGSISQVPLLGWVLGALVVAGLAVAWRVHGPRRLVRDAAPALALAGGAPLLLLLAGWGRGAYYGVERATESRYLYMVAAMFAPVIAVAAQALTDRWPRLSPAVVVLLVAGVPGNIAAADDRPPALRGDKDLVLALPTVEAAADAPDDATPPGVLFQDVRIGWLRDGVAQGDVPAPERVTPPVAARASVGLAFVQTDDEGPTTTCRRLDGPVVVQLAVGDRLAISGGVVQVRDATFDPPVVGGSWNPVAGGSVVVRATPPRLGLGPLDPKQPPTVCGLPPDG